MAGSTDKCMSVCTSRLLCPVMTKDGNDNAMLTEAATTTSSTAIFAGTFRALQHGNRVLRPTMRMALVWR